MKIRHKAPTFVSMWMLDVFCCALGCVTLLWLLKTREAGTVIAQNTSIRAELSDTRLALNDSDAARLMIGAQLDETIGNLALVREQRDDAARKLALTEEQAKEIAADLARARKVLAQLEAKNALDSDELAKKRAEVDALTRRVDVAMKSASDLEILVRDKERERAEAMRRAAELSTKLDTAGRELSAANNKADQMAKLENRLRIAERELLEKQTKIDDATAMIIDLQGTKSKLADKVNKLQIESENKFAGIATTGKRVVFLIDMSGSMDRSEENKIEPTKWPTVRDTVIKMMRSLPDLEKFQVILFSNKVVYLNGASGQWLDYKKDASIADVHQAMSAIRPAGDTNLYSGFEEAFKFRDKGLDTVYLFSDGLPTSGPTGLTVEQENRLSDAQKTDAMGKNLRKTIGVTWNKTDPRLAKVRINSVGFYYESPDLGAFLWALSRENDGNFVGMSRP